MTEPMTEEKAREIVKGVKDNILDRQFAYGYLARVEQEKTLGPLISMRPDKFHAMEAALEAADRMADVMERCWKAEGATSTDVEKYRAARAKLK